MRDLNKEYKDMVLNETPDIWSRIEAGLDERQKTATVQPVIPLQSVADKQHIAAAPKRKNVKIVRIMKYAGAAAAAVVCICLVIPLLRGSRASETAQPASARHIRSESAAADVAEAPQAMTDTMKTARAEEAAASETAGSQANQGKQAMNSYSSSTDNSDFAFELMPQDEAAAEETAEEAESEVLQYTGDKLIKITLVQGADPDSIGNIIEEFSLEFYEENDGAFVFMIPEGTDISELIDALSKNENVAGSEGITK